MGVDVQMQGWGQGASGVVAGGGGGAGGGATGASAAAAAAAALEQLADGEAAPNMKMELAYWYNMHSEMGAWCLFLASLLVIAFIDDLDPFAFFPCALVI